MHIRFAKEEAHDNNALCPAADKTALDRFLSIPIILHSGATTGSGVSPFTDILPGKRKRSRFASPYDRLDAAARARTEGTVSTGVGKRKAFGSRVNLIGPHAQNAALYFFVMEARTVERAASICWRMATAAWEAFAFSSFVAATR